MHSSIRVRSKLNAWNMSSSHVASRHVINLRMLVQKILKKKKKKNLGLICFNIIWPTRNNISSFNYTSFSTQKKNYIFYYFFKGQLQHVTINFFFFLNANFKYDYFRCTFPSKNKFLIFWHFHIIVFFQL